MAKRVTVKDTVIESTRRACNRTAGKEKCDEIFNSYQFGHKDTDTFLNDMDGAIKRGKRSKNLAKGRKKAQANRKRKKEE
jgi:hypothetical protein